MNMSLRHAVAYLTSSSAAEVVNQHGERYRIVVNGDDAWFEVCWSPDQWPQQWEPRDIRGHTFEVVQ